MNAGIEVCTPDEAASIINKLTGKTRGKLRDFPKLDLQGHIDVVCREASDGAVAWEVHKSNLITKWGRTTFSYTGTASDAIWGNQRYIAISASTLVADPRMSSILNQVADPYAAYKSGTLISSLSGMTKTWTTSFGVPSTARRIAAIALTPNDASYGGVINGVLYGVSAFTNLPSVKIQGTTQTLEVQYKLTFIPRT